MMSIEQTIEDARSCLGTMWVHQGRVPHKGLDCAGLVRYPMAASGVDIDFKRYQPEPKPELMQSILSHIFKQVDEWSLDTLEPCDILWLVVTGLPVHLALYTGRETNTIIHSVRGGPHRVIEHPFRYPWPERVFKVYRYRMLNCNDWSFGT